MPAGFSPAPTLRRPKVLPVLFGTLAQRYESVISRSQSLKSAQE